jgi:serine/threonine-protein kinase
MSSDPHGDRIEELFHQAKGLSPAEQIAFLNEACVDDPAEVRERAARLLDADRRMRRAGVRLDDSPRPEHWPQHSRAGSDDTTRKPTSGGERVANITADATLMYSVRGTDGKLRSLDSGAGAASLVPGMLLNDRYLLEQELGRGGMGVVFLGVDNRLERQVAIKTVLPGIYERVASDAAWTVKEMFESEARLGAKLLHPAIATVFDYGFHQEHAYIVFEYVPGETLREVIARRGRFPLDEVQLILPQLAQALDFAHSIRVVHRDLKPDNIRLTRGGDFKILDFGLAKQFDQLQDWRFAGTPAYAAPEQCAEEPSDGRADQYALALVVYEMLTGRRAFSASDPIALLSMHLSETPVSPIQLRRDLPQAASDAVMRGLAKNPGDRFQTCSAFALALGCRLLSSDRSPAQAQAEAYVWEPFEQLRFALRARNLGACIALDPRGLWRSRGDTVEHWPFACIVGVASHGSMLKLNLVNRGKVHTRRWWFVDDDTCSKWCHDLERKRRTTRSSDGADSGANVIQMIVTPTTPTAAWQQLGVVEATSQSAKYSRSLLCLRAAVAGADAVIGSQTEKITGFRENRWRNSGTAIRSLTAKGRQELVSRWYRDEVRRISNLLVGFGLAIVPIGMFQAEYRMDSFRQPDVEAPVAVVLMVFAARYFYWWPLIAAVVLRLLKWPQLVGPTACAFVALAVPSLAWIAGCVQAGVEHGVWSSVGRELLFLLTPFNVFLAVTGTLLARRLMRARNDYRRVVDRKDARPPIARIPAALALWFVAIIFGFFISVPDYATALFRTNRASALSAWRRADSYAKQSMWDEAAADLRRLIELDPDNQWNWFVLSPILQHLDPEQYREHCRKMLELFGDSQEPSVLEQVVKACSIAPDAVEDKQRLLQMAQRAVETTTADTPGFCWIALSRGLAAYRAGKDRDSIEWLHQSLNAPEKTAYLEAIVGLTLAMAHARLGEKELARLELAKAQRAMDSSFRKPDAGRLGDGWQDLLICWKLRAEAETVIAELTKDAAHGEPESRARRKRDVIDSGQFSRTAPPCNFPSAALQSAAC